GAGLASKDLFPEFKIGAEVFKQWGKKGEATFGYTYLKFSANSSSIYTASIGYYPGNWWLSARGYIVPSGLKLNPSALLFARRYLRTSDEYLGLVGGYGALFPQQLTTADYARLESIRLGIQWQYRVIRRFYFTGIMSLSSEDYTFQQNILRTSFQGGLLYRFK
ncbi:MAG: YaiO family outer membrane beta-barrel protein, partial [Bacteroidota bacterium]|nr:YaiO family outer membrane beta-barrel protein [Bacteroidota bacterium]MDX5430798.1 YaiO family outer membrane beta-barrel protein [Bacteroidota bacterium]MDX5469543.1 YaiO family outer membrane beta-barrel protein [Bacteroidota bacterium]